MVGPASAEGEYFRANGSAADYVGGGVTNDEHFRSCESLAERHCTAGEGDFGKLISVFVVITESADGKRMPEVEMPQFDFGAEPDIAGQEPDSGWWCEH